jgi:hypothetical protein
MQDVGAILTVTFLQTEPWGNRTCAESWINSPAPLSATFAKNATSCSSAVLLSKHAKPPAIDALFLTMPLPLLSDMNRLNTLVTHSLLQHSCAARNSSHARGEHLSEAIQKAH